MTRMPVNAGASANVRFPESEKKGWCFEWPPPSSTKTAQSEWIFWRKKICRSGIRKHCPIPDLAGRKGTLVWSGLVWQDKYTMMVVLRLLHIYYANSNTNIKKDRKEKKIKSKVWSLVA